jgi:hypothetical protein
MGVELMRESGLPYILVVIGIAVWILFLLNTWGVIKFPFKRAEIETLDVQLTKTLRVLQENAQQANELSTQLQNEVSNRAKALHALEDQLKELRHQKNLLDLPSEQKEALQRLLKKSATTREIFTSSDFWFGQILGNVVVSALFYMLGIRHERKQSHNLP